MRLLCEGCNELKEYYRLDLNEEFHPYRVGNCPTCGSNVFEVDELIAYTIIELNKKGWTTQFCCSGHMEEKIIATYIKFKHMPESCPLGFYIDKDCIRVKNNVRNLEGLKGYDELVFINRRLYHWALKLPKREEVVVNV